LEAAYYRSGQGESHVIETKLGRIGVGICYENLLFARLRDLYHARVDLVLQPMAAGRLIPLVPGDLERFDSLIRRGAPHTARVLGVPVVMANRAGGFDIPQSEGEAPLHSTFCGLSRIVDADGRVKAKLGEDEGMIAGEVQLGVGRRAATPPKCIGTRWALRVPWYAFIWPATQYPAQRAYLANERRRACARARAAPARAARGLF
jgi:N-carbamoylputrescine amidase